MAAKNKYVIVGTGGRSSMYIKALAVDYTKIAELKVFCNTNQIRMDFWNKELKDEYKHAPVKTYKAEDFDLMIKEQKPE